MSEEFEESRPQPVDVDTEIRTAAEMVERGWELPTDAHLADTVKQVVLGMIEQGYADPQMIAAFAIGPAVVAIGRLEHDLADARRRIDQLEQALRERGA
ncbi:hypothetical protein [Nocardia sp. AG03]|uniref:hypothetical protein n=1 Tax=Nocardia sp. AG03 TaxID=3025312 RepID=UPI0024188A4E|nr:hypothetical protein [Nocardia sp. AG03]